MPLLFSQAKDVQPARLDISRQIIKIISVNLMGIREDGGLLPTLPGPNGLTITLILLYAEIIPVSEIMDYSAEKGIKMLSGR